MEENKSYSVDEILAQTGRRRAERSAKDISARADEQAKEILDSLRKPAPDDKDAEFEQLLREITARNSKKRKSPEREFKELPKTEEPKTETKIAPVSVTRGESEIKIAPEISDIPQSKKRVRSIDDVIRSVSNERENKIDRAVSLEKEEQTASDKKQLTRTGVIRKADSLISEQSEPAPAPAAEMADRMGNPKKTEKIVGDKEDIQTKLYNEYIRRKEKKKQDTGIIKAIDIKIADKADEKTQIMPPVKTAAKKQAEKTIISPVKTNSPKLGLIDEETDIEKTLVSSSKERVISNFHHTGNIEGQTRLEGFFDEEAVEKISEDELEEQLELNRREKVGSFELEKEFKDKNREAAEAPPRNSLDDTYAPEKETPIINDIVDYNSKNDRRAVYLELEGLKNRFKLRTVLTFAAEIIAVIIGIFGSGIITDFGLGTGGERVYIIINAAIFLFMLIINGRAVLKGLKALFMLKPSGDSLSAFAAVVTLVHCAVALTMGENGAGVSHLYVGTAGFILLLNCFGKRSMLRRIFKNFRFIIKGEEKYSCACITEEKEITEFAKGTQLPYYDIRYNAKTEFPTRFLANSFADDPADNVARYTAYPIIGVSAIIAIISYFITKDLLSAVSALTALLLIGVPASALMAFNKALENADSALLKERGTISGFAAVEDTAGTTAVALGSEELFPEGCCSLKGMKLFKKMQMDDAILYAASVLEDTKHPFRSVFMESISEVKDRMPKSFDTAYESKLGLSSWIYDRKVLLGTKEMMGAHGIEIPATAKPEEYIKDNVRVMFLAIDGAVYAMFVLEYFSDPIIEYELQRLEASGIEILVRTEDANVDEALLSDVFELDFSSLKILSMVASSMYNEKTGQPVFNEAKLINRGDTVTFMRSVTACSILSGQFRLLRTLQYIAAALGVGVVSVFSLLGSISSIGPVHIVAYAAFWMIVTNLIPRIYKAVPKR